ncbi:MAG: 2-oxoacid:acceptor oxidoreductase subunit alpha [Nitrososphaerota archaeon]|nr:2-oxoacid:acceptor oxidoreductase subunit alpha [Nitrososphaerota archaeon]
MIGGAQGSGVDLAASAFARSCVSAGLWVYGSREYYSNIKGLHSYFEIRTSGRQIRSKVEGVDLLSTFDAETLVRHSDAVNPGGGIIYDPGVSKAPIDKVETLYKDEVKQVQGRLKQQGLSADISGILEEAKRRDVKLFAVPYGALIQDVARRLGTSELSRLNRIVNVLAASVSLALLKLDRYYISESVRQAFSASRKQKLIDMNIAGVERAYEFAGERFEDELSVRLSPMQNMSRMFVVGNQAVAMGKIVGGCRLQTYYPITPASDESEFLEAHENFALQDGVAKDGKGSVVVVQTEDEIAAITMAIGGALAGTRAATSTSGPGFSLMTEGMGWAGMNEVPVVITLYSRGGPSTGMPTRTEQGDLKLALNASHGEFPRIVLCSGDMEECFYDAFRAMNYAERYQLPVIHLVDKGLANSNMTILPPDPNLADIERGKLIMTANDGGTPSDGEYRRFAFTQDGISPRAVLGLKGYRFWNTGDEHDELGHINENAENRVKMMTKRMTKLETADREIPLAEKVNFYAAKGRPDVTLVSWGSSKGAILEGMELLAKKEINAEFLQIRMASPFPTQAVKERLSQAKLVVDIEQNYTAQMAAVISEKTQINIRNRIVKFNGRTISQNEIYDSVRQIVAKPEANERVILTHGA